MESGHEQCTVQRVARQLCVGAVETYITAALQQRSSAPGGPVSNDLLAGSWELILLDRESTYLAECPVEFWVCERLGTRVRSVGHHLLGYRKVA